MGNEAKQTANDLKVLVDHVEEERKAHAKGLTEAQEKVKKDQAKAKAGKGVISSANLMLADTMKKTAATA